MAADRENKVRQGLYVDDDRTSIFEKSDDGSTAIHRKFGGQMACLRSRSHPSRELAQDIHDVLAVGGKLIAIRYSMQMKRTFQRLFGRVSISFVPLNILPAFFYTCTKSVH